MFNDVLVSGTWPSGSVIHIRVSVLFQILFPLDSNRVHKTVLYICVSFALSHTGLSLPSF